MKQKHRKLSICLWHALMGSSFYCIRAAPHDPEKQEAAVAGDGQQHAVMSPPLYSTHAAFCSWNDTC
eukprot:5392657-Amphidinium_carterae.2